MLKYNNALIFYMIDFSRIDSSVVISSGALFALSRSEQKMFHLMLFRVVIPFIHNIRVHDTTQPTPVDDEHST
jgi:hypothetical protein